MVLTGLALLAQGLSFGSLSDMPNPSYEAGMVVPVEWGLVGEGYGVLNFQVLTVVLIVASELLHVLASRAGKEERGALVLGTN